LLVRLVAVVVAQRHDRQARLVCERQGTVLRRPYQPGFAARQLQDKHIMIIVVRL
jgi:hypothetical protein